MRAVLPCLALTIVSALALAPLTGAQDDEASAEDALRFFLHATGECQGQATPDLFMDTEDSTGDIDGCTTFYPAGVDIAAESSYPSTEALGLEVTEASTAVMHVFVRTNNPADVTVSTTFTVGKKRCSGTSGTESVTNTPATGSWAEFIIECAFEGKAEEAGTAAKKPSLLVSVTTDFSVTIGYEGDHASNIEIMGLSQSLPPTPEVVEGEPEEESPGPGVLLAIVAVAASGLVALRRRD